MLWAKHFRLHTAFNLLPSDLAIKLTCTAILLERGSHSEVQNFDDDQAKAAQEIDTAKRRQLCDGFAALIEQARALPGIKRFMLPEHFRALCAATAQGLVAVPLANGVTCQAIVIESADTVHQVQLPDVSLQSLQNLSHIATADIHRGCESLRGRIIKQSHVKSGQKAEEVLREFWQKAVRRIVDTIHLTV